jgi:hypothetical protein
VYHNSSTQQQQQLPLCVSLLKPLQIQSDPPSNNNTIATRQRSTTSINTSRHRRVGEAVMTIARDEEHLDTAPPPPSPQYYQSRPPLCLRTLSTPSSKAISYPPYHVKNFHTSFLGAVPRSLLNMFPGSRQSMFPARTCVGERAHRYGVPLNPRAPLH